MQLITSNSLLMLEQSMNFLWAKQAAHLDNVSNAETPGYKVKTVTFEQNFAQKLREAVQADREKHGMVETRKALERADWTVTEDEESTRMDDNGVNVIEQLTEAVRTSYQLQYTMHTISSDLNRLRSAIKGN